MWFTDTENYAWDVCEMLAWIVEICFDIMSIRKVEKSTGTLTLYPCKVLDCELQWHIVSIIIKVF